MSVGIIHILEFVDIQDQKGVKRIRVAHLQEMIDGRLRMFFIIYGSQAVNLGRVNQLSAVSGVDHGDAPDQQDDQDHEIRVQGQFVVPDKGIAGICDGYWNYIAHHPVIQMERRVCNVVAAIRIFRVKQLDQTVRLGLKGIADGLKGIFSADATLAVKIEKVVIVGNLLARGITIQRDDISIFIDDDTKTLAIE